MAEHNWPAMLPCFLVDGYGRGGEDAVIRSELGRATKIRRRYTALPPEQVSANVVCDKAQLQTLLDFYAITLGRVLPFNYRDHTKPDATLVEYRFTERPSYAPEGSGMYWRVSLSLEQLTTYQGTFPLSDEHGNNLLSSPGGDELTT